MKTDGDNLNLPIEVGLSRALGKGFLARGDKFLSLHSFHLVFRDKIGILDFFVRISENEAFNLRAGSTLRPDHHLASLDRLQWLFQFRGALRKNSMGVVENRELIDRFGIE